ESFDRSALLDGGQRVVFPLVAAANQTHRNLFVGAKRAWIQIQEARGDNGTAGFEERSAVLTHITPYSATRITARRHRRRARQAPGRRRLVSRRKPWRGSRRLLVAAHQMESRLVARSFRPVSKARNRCRR